MRIAVLALALLSSLTAWPSAAGAVTWHNSGDTTFTATGGAYAFSINNAFLSCTSSVMTGTMSASGIGTTWAAGTIVTTSTCAAIGTNYIISCRSTFTAMSQSTGVVPAVTSGRLDSTCDWTTGSSGVPFCHVEGQMPVEYRNPTPPATGRFTSLTGTTQVATGTGGCIVGSGPYETSPTSFFVASGTGGPRITRTA